MQGMDDDEVMSPSSWAVQHHGTTGAAAAAAPLANKRKRVEVIDLTISEEDVFKIPNYVYHEQVKLGYFSFYCWAKRHFSPFPVAEFNDRAIRLLFDMFSLEAAEQEAATIEIKVQKEKEKKAAYKEWRKAICVPYNIGLRFQKIQKTIAIAKVEASKEKIDRHMTRHISKINSRLKMLSSLLPRVRRSTLAEEEEVADNEEDSEDDDEDKFIRDVRELKVKELKKKSFEALTGYRARLESIALEKLHAARKELKDQFELVTRRHYWYSTIKVTLNNFEKLPPEILGVIASNLKPHEIVHFRDALGPTAGSENYKAVTSVAEQKWAAQRAARLFTKNLFRNGQPLSTGANHLWDRLRTRYEFFDFDVYTFLSSCAYAAEEKANKGYLRIIQVGFNVEYRDGEIIFHPRALVREHVDLLHKYKQLREVETSVGSQAAADVEEASHWGAYYVVEYPLPYDPRERNDLLDATYDETVFSTPLKDINDWFDDKTTFTLGDDISVCEQRRFLTTDEGMPTFPISVGDECVPFDPDVHRFEVLPLEEEDMMEGEEEFLTDDEDVEVELLEDDDEEDIEDTDIDTEDDDEEDAVENEAIDLTGEDYVHFLNFN